MKIEYTQSPFGIDPDMIITGSEFQKSREKEDDAIFLRFAVDAFTLAHGFENNLGPRDYDLAQKWLRKNSYVRFVIKELFYNPFRIVRWCEIYVITDGSTQKVVTSENGEQFNLFVPPEK